jgi:hypothetical protein
VAQVFGTHKRGCHANRPYLRRRGIRCTIPGEGRPDPQPQEQRLRWWPPAPFAPRALQAASPAQAHRAVATRYDQLAVCYEAAVYIAAINEWLPRRL